MKTFKQFITKSYREIEFLCVNTKLGSSTEEKNQMALYHDLELLDNVFPLLQNWNDWEDDGQKQISLSAIITTSYDKSIVKDIEDKIKALAKKHNIEIDMINNVTDDYLDRAFNGEHENQVSNP